MNTISSLLKFIGSKPMVIEQGTSGIWEYRKWSDGTAECWGISSDHTVSTSNAYGSNYYASLETLNFPSGLFITKPEANIALQGGDGLWAAINGLGATYISYYPFCSRNGNHNIVPLVRAIGKWK